MLILTEDKIDAFVQEQNALGNDVWWEGWELCFHRPDPRAIYSGDGGFRNGVIGYVNRVPVSENGTWGIDFRNVKRRKR